MKMDGTYSFSTAQSPDYIGCKSRKLKPRTKGVVTTVVTVECRKQEYSSWDWSREKKLRDLQHVLVCQINNDLTNAIEDNIIRNNAFAQRDIKNTGNLFGSSIP